jgi:hypothetical protein
MTRTDALVALVKDHTMARHTIRAHPDCPVCHEMRRDVTPEWVRRLRANDLPVKVYR